jgi:hypothetical protein
MPAAKGKALHVLARAIGVGDEDEQKVHHVSVLSGAGGGALWKLDDCGLMVVAELKRLVEAKTGLGPGSGARSAIARRTW